MMDLINTEQNSSTLNSISLKYAKAGVSFSLDSYGFLQAQLSHKGNSANILLYGAQVNSWSSSEFGECLFVSQHSYREVGKPIRGGIPLCFPQFAKLGSLPQHGFARTTLWQVVASESSQAGVSVSLELNDSQAKLWQGNPTRTTLVVTLSDHLLTELKVENLSNNPIFVTQAFHTYFSVDVHATQISDLNGCDFRDALENDQVFNETRKSIPIDRAINRVYRNAPDQLVIEDSKLNRRFTIQKENQSDAVLWNPWINTAKELQDFGDQEYLNMVCLESGNIDNAAQIAAGGVQQFIQRLSVAKIY